MSDLNKQKPSNASEEVDLIVFFNLIGNAINRLFTFIGSIFKAIFSVFIHSIKIIIQNWKIIAGVILIAFLLGYGLEKTKKPVYSSSMLVRPYFESKYQLVNNIEYFNTLISNQDYKTIKSVFSINEEEVKAIKSFEVNPGPESDNEKLIEYKAFLKEIDSNSVENLSFEEFIDNRDIYSVDLFLITAQSYRKDIFLSLEDGLNASFSNKYSEKKKKKRDSLITIQKETIKANLEEVAALQKVYIDVLKEDAGSKNPSISLGGETLSLPKDKSNTREYELLDKQIQLRNKLQKLDEEKIEDDVYFDVISSFQKTGNPVSKLREKYSIIFPIFGFILLTLFYISKRIINYTQNYED